MSSLDEYLLLMLTSATQTHDSEESCLELNTEYFGNGIFLHENVSNWNDCAELCEKESTCKYWTFKKPLTEQYGECELKRSDSGRSSNSGAVSGGRNCQGEDVIYLIDKVVDLTPNIVPISLRTYEHTAPLHTKSRAIPKIWCLFRVQCDPKLATPLGRRSGMT